MQMIAAALAAACLGAAPDNNVEWDGVSHIGWQDRRPLCPIAGETFEVRFQAYALDLTGASVTFDAGSGPVSVEAVYLHDRGPYAVWAATIPATAAGGQVHYHIELRDGTDTDYLSVTGMSDGPPSDDGFVVDFATLTHAPIGATPTSDGGAVFKVWAPSPGSATVRGDFNGWSASHPMMRQGEFFVAHVPAVAARAQYKYVFDNGGELWRTDARARSLNAGDNLNSRVEDPLGYEWQSEGFRTPVWDELVVYQLHVGTFSGRNDPYGFAPIPARYVDVARRAPHLAELGVNAVLLNPITEFPFDFSAGYNPISMYAPEWKYGAPDQLKLMIDRLHEHGIAVIMDVVWNHLSPTDNYLWDYDGSQIYFDSPAAQTPWGAQADFDNPNVADYYVDSMLLWLEEYRVDGFRFDGTNFMNMEQGAAGWALMQRANDVIDGRYVDRITIAEQLPDDPWVTRPTALGGAGFDAQYHDAFNDRLREAILDAAFGDPNLSAVAAAIDGEQYLSGAQTLRYLELHDEAWPSSGGQRLVRTIDTVPPHDDEFARGRVLLGHGLVMTSPGIPAMLMGTEWLEDTNFGGGDAAGNDRIDWSKKVTNAPVFSYFQDLIALRRSNPALRAGSPHEIYHVNDAGNVLIMQRWTDAGDVLVVAANFSNSDYAAYRLGLPQPGRWGEVLNSQAAAYGGSGLTNPGSFQAEEVPYDGFGQSAEIVLPRMGLVVLQWNPPAVCLADMDANGTVDVFDLLAFLDSWFSQAAAADIDGVSGVDVFDLLAFLDEWFPASAAGACV